jgi:hypothetical protein
MVCWNSGDSQHICTRYMIVWVCNDVKLTFVFRKTLAGKSRYLSQSTTSCTRTLLSPPPPPLQLTSLKICSLTSLISATRSALLLCYSFASTFFAQMLWRSCHGNMVSMISTCHTKSKYQGPCARSWLRWKRRSRSAPKKNRPRSSKKLKLRSSTLPIV